MNTMKSTIATILVLLITPALIAQKAKVVSAYNYNKSYERDKECSELVKGIESIEPATKEIKTSRWAKTWYYGGNLYFNAALTDDKECASKFPDALDKTFDYYLTSIKFNILDETAHDLDLDKQEDAMKFVGFLMNRDTKYEDRTYMV